MENKNIVVIYDARLYRDCYVEDIGKKIAIFRSRTFFNNIEHKSPFVILASYVIYILVINNFVWKPITVIANFRSITLPITRIFNASFFRVILIHITHPL